MGNKESLLGLSLSWFYKHNRLQTTHKHSIKNGCYICKKNIMSDLIEKGITACKAGQFDEGVKYFSKAVDKDPSDLVALHHRTRALSKIERLEDALLDFDRLVELAPNNAMFIGDYAVALHLSDQNEKAEMHFELALKLEPENAYRYSSRAFYKDRMGDLKGAIKDYEKAIELDPDDEISFNNKGIIEEKLGYKEKANKSFAKSNKLVGYELKSIEKNEGVEKKNIHNSPQTKKEIIRSLTTKKGMKDFLQFTTKLFRGKAEK